MNSEPIWHKWQESYDRRFPLVWLGLFILTGISIWYVAKPASVESTLRTDLSFTPIPLNSVIPGESIGGAVNLRTAKTAQLESLDGIGPKKAAAIVQARESGQLNSAADLAKVKGIGPKLYNEIKDQLIWE